MAHASPELMEEASAEIFCGTGKLADPKTEVNTLGQHLVIEEIIEFSNSGKRERTERLKER